MTPGRFTTVFNTKRKTKSVLKREKVIVLDTRGHYEVKRNPCLSAMSWLSSVFRFNYVILSDTGGKTCEHLWWVSEVEGHWRLHFLLAPVGASLSTTDTLLWNIRGRSLSLFHLAVIQTMWALVICTPLSNPQNEFKFKPIQTTAKQSLIISMQSHHWVSFIVSCITEGIEVTWLLALSYNWKQMHKPHLIWL